VLCSFYEHGLDVSPNWWMRSVISDANAVSNGVLLGAFLKLYISVHLVDDDLAYWIWISA